MSTHHHHSSGEDFIIPPDGTPVYYQGQVVGRVVSSVQDEINIEIDEQHREAVRRALELGNGPVNLAGDYDNGNIQSWRIEVNE